MLKQILQNDFVVIIDIFPTTASSSDLVTLMDKSDNIVVNYNFCVSLEKCECLEMHIIRKYHYYTTNNTVLLKKQLKSHLFRQTFG